MVSSWTWKIYLLNAKCKYMFVSAQTDFIDFAIHELGFEKFGEHDQVWNFQPQGNWWYYAVCDKIFF